MKTPSVEGSGYHTRTTIRQEKPGSRTRPGAPPSHRVGSRARQRPARGSWTHRSAPSSIVDGRKRPIDLWTPASALRRQAAVGDRSLERCDPVPCSVVALSKHCGGPLACKWNAHLAAEVPAPVGMERDQLASARMGCTEDHPHIGIRAASSTGDPDRGVGLDHERGLPTRWYRNERGRRDGQRPDQSGAPSSRGHGHPAPRSHRASSVHRRAFSSRLGSAVKPLANSGLPWALHCILTHVNY